MVIFIFDCYWFWHRFQVYLFDILLKYRDNKLQPSNVDKYLEIQLNYSFIKFRFNALFLFSRQTVKMIRFTRCVQVFSAFLRVSDFRCLNNVEVSIIFDPVNVR